MIQEVCVVIPAADEERLVGGCLTSVVASAGALSRSLARDVDVRILVVLDGCSDRTASVVGGFGDVGTVSIADRSVGSARLAGTDAVLRRAGRRIDPECLLLANTDADCRVPVTWLAHLVGRADAGSDLVMGTVRPGPGLLPAVRAAWHARHRLDGGHPHVHGANLAVRASALADLGGWRAVESDEDVDLARRMERAGARICRTGGAPVVTSSRPAGRTPQGFSSFLRALASEVQRPPSGSRSAPLSARCPSGITPCPRR